MEENRKKLVREILGICKLEYHEIKEYSPDTIQELSEVISSFEKEVNMNFLERNLSNFREKAKNATSGKERDYYWGICDVIAGIKIYNGISPRYFVDIRNGCGAVRDKWHKSYDEEYHGLHSYTPDVVEYKGGYKEGDGWRMKKEDIDYLNELCDKLNMSLKTADGSNNKETLMDQLKNNK